MTRGRMIVIARKTAVRLCGWLVLSWGLVLGEHGGSSVQKQREG